MAVKILGIETSCDETAASVVEDGQALLSNVVASQIDIHKAFGGVVPEVAARNHIEIILPVIDQALREAFPDIVQRFSQPDESKEIAKRGVSSTEVLRTSTGVGDKGVTGSSVGEESSALLQDDALSEALWEEIDAIAVTHGAGLSGSLLIGVLTARTLALIKNKPLYGVNHVLGHVYANFLLDEQPEFPMLALIVSGGHSQLALFKDHFDYQLLGQTQDDAVGEAFDKVAKVIGLPYPGGPSIQKAAESGDPTFLRLPKAKLPKREIILPKEWNLRPSQADGAQGKAEERTESYSKYEDGAPEASTQRSAVNRAGMGGSADQQGYVVRGSYDFSFSGLKTAVLRQVQELCGKDYSFPSFELAELLKPQQVNDIAASFQFTAIETLVDKTMSAFEEFQPETVVIAGGVAANTELRRQLQERLPTSLNYAPINLCTDNAAMIATLGYYQAQETEASDPHKLEINPQLSM